MAEQIALSPQVKRVIISYKLVYYKMSYKLPNHLRLRILEN